MKRNSLSIGLLVFVVVLLFEGIFSKWNTLYELIYFKGLFQIIRIVHDYSLGFIPFPTIYLIVPLMVLYFYRNRIQGRFSALLTTASFFIWIINFFYLLWGFNYNQRTVADRLNLPEVTIDSSYIADAFIEQTKLLDSLILSLDSSELSNDYINHLRKAEEKILDQWGIPVIGRVQVRKLWPGSLIHFRTSGIYIPHAFEGHIDPGLYWKQWPFTAAHEMAHGYGITDESECNFIAYLACRQSGQWHYVYSAELAYWRYLASYYRKWHPDNWENTYAELNPVLQTDLENISQHIRRYKDWMPNYRDKIYDKYLKSHGVKAGIRSYDLMIVLIAAYNEKEK